MALFQLLTASATKVYSPGQMGAAQSNGTQAVYPENVTVQNRGPNSIYYGFASTVTTGTGEEIPTGASASFKRLLQPLWAIAITANQVSPSDTRVTVEATY
jgi:hypothetical protein